MGIGVISIWQILIILIVVLLFFGGTKRIKSLGADLANTIKSFRKTMDEEDKDKDKSALAGGTDKDSVDNKSIAINVNKWFDNINFRTALFSRSNFANIDGHSLAIQNGHSNNDFYAFQTGADYVTKDYTNYITLHTHEYNRRYESNKYKASNYFFKIVGTLK